MIIFGKREEKEEEIIEAQPDLFSYFDEKFKNMTEELEEENSQQSKKVNETIEKLNGTIGKLTDGLNQILSDMRSELEAVKNIALEKEIKIQRYEEGYDQKIIKSFLNEILRIIDFAGHKKDDNDVVSEIYDDLELLLENEGIEKISLSIGDSYDGNEKMVKVTSTSITKDASKDNTVCEIKKDGYLIEIANEQNKVIRSTEVILYKYEDEDKKWQII